MATQQTELRLADSDDLKLVVQAAQDAIDLEFKVAERLDAKSRNQVAIAATWFALAQAAVSVAFGRESGPGDTLGATMLVCGALAAVGLVATLILSFLVWRPRDEEEVSPEGLRQMARAARERPVEFPDLMFRHYGAILRARRDNNKERVRWFRWATWPWSATLLLTAAELAAALVSIGQS